MRRKQINPRLDFIAGFPTFSLQLWLSSHTVFLPCVYIIEVLSLMVTGSESYKCSFMCNEYIVLMVTNIFPFFFSFVPPFSSFFLECWPAFALSLHATMWLHAAINTLTNCSAICCYGSHSATLFCMFADMIFIRKFPCCTVQRQLLCLQQQHLPQVFPSLQQPQPTRFANLQLPFLRTTLNQCCVITLCSPFLLLAYRLFFSI